MKSIKFWLLIFMTLSACEQSPQTNKTKTVSPATSEAYRDISTEFCNCVSATMRNNRPSTTFDSCYNVVLLANTDKLKQLGIDAKTESGQLKISVEILKNLNTTCSETHKLLQKEYDNKNVNKLFFKGTIASQKKLLNGEIEIIMINTKTKESQTFKSNSFLEDPSIKNSGTLSYELTVEYEIRHNPKNNKDEYCIKENAPTSGLSIQKVEKKN